MDGNYRRLAGYLTDLGLQEVPHWQGDRPLLAHLLGVYHLLQAQGCSEELCRAGMFHQIYGTEGPIVDFQLSLDFREEVADLIGERAERLAYLDSAMNRESFDAALERGTPPYRFTDRFLHAEIELSAEDF